MIYVNDVFMFGSTRAPIDEIGVFCLTSPKKSMEIQGTVLIKNSDRIRIVTEDKMQEIDIFVTASRKADISDLIEREFVHLSVQIQSVEYNGDKLGKFWLMHVIFPKKIVKDTRRGGKGEGDRNWSDSRNKNP